MAEENKNNVPEQEKTTEVQDRGLFDFMKKKEEVKPQETTTNLSSEFDNKTQISVNQEVEEHKENKPTLVEQLHQKHEEEEENKPSLLHKLHRSNSSSSSSSEEEGEDGEKRKKKKEKKKMVEGDVKTEEESKGIMDKIKEKLPGHAKKPEDSSPVETATPVTEHEEEKKGFIEKIKEKLPGHHHDKTNGEEEKEEKKSD